MKFFCCSNESDMGASGDGQSLYDFKSIIGSGNGHIVFANTKNDTTTYMFSTSISIPSNIVIEVENGARLTLATGVTLTIEGPFKANRYKVFDLTGTATIDGLNDVYPEWFGAEADVSTPTDDSTAFSDALSAISSKGGNLILDSKSQYYIASDLNIPMGCAIIGSNALLDPRKASDLEFIGSIIYLNSANTIILDGDSAALKQIAIIRYGSTFPADSTEVGNFAGKAIGSTDEKHGFLIRDVTIIGFEYAISIPETDDGSPWTSQVRIHNVNIDCTNGIYINGSLDVCYISQVHCWPMATKGLAGETDADLRRSGFAFMIDDSNDWTKFTDCFSYGYLKGFYVKDSHSVTFLNCSTDYTSTMTGQPVGLKVEGSCADIRAIGFQAAGQYHGMNISTDNADGSVQVIGCTFWDIDNNGILLDDGDLVVIGSKFRDMPQCIGINSANAGRVVSDGNLFDTITTAVFAAHASHDKSYWAIGENNTYVNCTAVVNANFDIPSFTDADATPDVTSVKKWKTGSTGATNITDFDGDLYEGQELIIIGADGGNSTIKHNASYINLSGGTDFTLNDGDTLHLIYDGADWNELGRSDNTP